MRFRITNRSRGLVTVQLNTGDSVHLAPGEQSEPIPDYETDGNPWLAKLVDRQLASVERDAPARRRSPRTRRRKS
jgi:hypothetical protein